MLRNLLLLTIVIFASPLWAQEVQELKPDDSAEFKSLFNGKDLTGWDGDSRLWSVKDGAIRGETTAENKAHGNTFLIWQDGDEDGVLADFELRFSFRCNAVNNSGFQYRSSRVPVKEDAQNQWILKGYQHEIRNEHKFPNTPGFIYDERGKRGRICPLGEVVVWEPSGKKVVGERLITQAEFSELMKIDDWNDVIIIAKGNRIRHYLNGRLVIDFTDNHPELALSEGVIGLQLHAGKAMWAEFKDIKVRELE